MGFVPKKYFGKKTFQEQAKSINESFPKEEIILQPEISLSEPIIVIQEECEIESSKKEIKRRKKKNVRRSKN